MANKIGNDDLDELDVTCSFIEFVTSDDVPAGMSVMAFAAFVSADRRFHLHPRLRLRIFSHQVRIPLITVLPVRRQP